MRLGWQHRDGQAGRMLTTQCEWSSWTTASRSRGIPQDGSSNIVTGGTCCKPVIDPMQTNFLYDGDNLDILRRDLPDKGLANG